MNTFDFRIESIELKEQHSEIIQFLDDRIYEYNSSIIDKRGGDLFTKIIKNSNSDIIAGITGWIWQMAKISEITLFWVDEKYRGKQLGRMLLHAAENEVRKKGCLTMLVRSYSFQAPQFYEKNGYRTVHVLDDFPEGYKHYTLVKRIPKL